MSSEEEQLNSGLMNEQGRDDADEEVFKFLSNTQRLSGNWADIVEEEEELLKQLKDITLEGGISQPVDQTIKVFVGQLPKDMKEEGVRSLFKDYVTVIDCCIIRNKMTKESRGCAFVVVATKEEAERAVYALHNKRILYPARRPLQVKLVDDIQKLSTQNQDHKLFVGMVPKHIDEKVIQHVFEQCGPVEDVMILRDIETGEHRGCAFVKYKAKEHAFSAIEHLHDKYRIEGSSANLVVKFAETERDKVRKSQLSRTRSGSSSSRSSSPGFSSGQQSPIFISMHSPPGMHKTPLSASRSRSFEKSQIQLLSSSPPIRTTPFSPPVGRRRQRSFSLEPESVRSPASRQVTGPADANLFVYYLPQEVGDEDLAQLFSPYGNVLSAKVFVDKFTGMSKCFGFVSYDNSESAQEAIQNMDGKKIGSKYIQVRLK